MLLRPSGWTNTDDQAGRFVVIAGHRRVAAARLAGLTHVLALVGNVDDDEAKLMQLAENVQREELALKDVAKAVRALFDRFGDQKTVAKLVKKSQPWVSKHLKITCPEFSYRATHLLEHDLVNDLELLGMISKLDKIAGHQDSDRVTALVNKIKAKKAGRVEARALLDELKEADKRKKKERAARKKIEGNTMPAAPVFQGWHWLNKQMASNVAERQDALDTLTDAQLAKVWSDIEGPYLGGKSHRPAAPGTAIRAALRVAEQHDNLAIAAWLVGYEQSLIKDAAQIILAVLAEEDKRQD